VRINLHLHVVRGSSARYIDRMNRVSTRHRRLLMPA
jgi:hypothetical protein